jgi:predicted transcriptional regulator
MDGRRVGRAHRAIRHRLGLRQADVAAKAGIGRWKIVMLEAGEVDDLRSATSSAASTRSEDA